MSIHDELVFELRDAIRNGDRPRVNVIRQVESEVAIARTAAGFRGEVDDALYLQVIAAYVKKMTKARKEYEAVGARGRDHAGKLGYEIDYLGRWLPQPLSMDETRELVRVTIAELDTVNAQQVGRVMGAIMKSGANVDGGVVSRIVREELGA